MKIVNFSQKQNVPNIYECECGGRIFHIYDDRSVKCALCDDYLGLICTEREENGDT